MDVHPLAAAARRRRWSDKLHIKYLCSVDHMVLPSHLDLELRERISADTNLSVGRGRIVNGISSC